MFSRLLFLFIFIPIIELYLLIQVGARIGFGPTLGLIFLTGYKNNNMKEEATKSVYEMIRLIGDDPEREGVEETPKRVVKSW